MDDDETNPFRGPRSRPEAPPAAVYLRPGRALAAWAIVVLLNLPLPLLFAGSVIDRDGASGLGMASAALLLVLAGGWICFQSDRLGLALNLGGVAVALFQFFPLPQVIAGAIGLAIADAAGLAGSGPDHPLPPALGWPGGFLVTLVTGALLITLALALGWSLPLLAPARWRRGPCGFEDGPVRP